MGINKKYRKKIRKKGRLKRRPLKLGDGAVITAWLALSGDRQNGHTPWQSARTLLEFLDEEPAPPARFWPWFEEIKALDHGSLLVERLHSEVMREESESARERPERSSTNLSEIEKKATAAAKKGRGFVPPENSGVPSLRARIECR